MKISKCKMSDIDQIVNIWLAGSLKAHDFICEEYWESQKEAMATKYLPVAETFVICGQEKEQILGFVSMLEDYLAALFIDPSYQHKGLGRTLLNFVKEQRDRIELKVYQKNENAIRFYLRNRFVITEESVDEPTQEKEFVMVWVRETDQ
jgi:putative acetyltransferase